MITEKGHRVNREELLHALEAVRPGLSPKPLVEHSNSFLFRGGYVETFNDEVACRMRTKLPKGLRGIVASKSLLAYLSRSPDATIAVSVDEETKQFKIRGGKGRWADLLTAFETAFQIDGVERPGKNDWKSLSPRFGDAIGMVAECAGKDESKRVLTCVHVHPEYVEASDDIQWCRYKVKTKTPAAFLVKRDSVKHLVGLDMTEFAETDAWVHFKNPAGLVFSCRRLAQKFPDVSQLLESAGGKKLTLPTNLEKEIEGAAQFAAEDKDQNAIVVDLKPGSLSAKGVGVTGRGGVRNRPCDYMGKPLSFLIQPKMLAELVKRGKECVVERVEGDPPQHRLRMVGDRFNYLTDLARPQVVQKAAEARQQAEEEEAEE